MDSVYPQCRLETEDDGHSELNAMKLDDKAMDEELDIKNKYLSVFPLT